jgi:hypothetical protein
MLPLTEPVFGDLTQTSQRLVKPKIALRTQQGRQSSTYDVGKAEDAKKVNN